MKTGFLLAFVAWSSLVQAAGTSELDQQNGFRDTKFGMSPSDLGEIKLYQDRDGVRRYRRPADDLAIGNVKAFVIEYVFFQDRLMRVELTTTPMQGLKLIEAFTSRFGPANPTEASGQKSVWLGSRVSLLVDASSASYTTFSFVGIPIQQERNMWMIRQGKELR